MHELIGHGSGSGSSSGGGVNAWDPHHPFRLASAGDNCTVHLWNIRKASARACLGVLNQENDLSSSFANSNDFAIRKKQRFEVHHSNRSLPRMQEGWNLTEDPSRYWHLLLAETL